MFWRCWGSAMPACWQPVVCVGWFASLLANHGCWARLGGPSCQPAGDQSYVEDVGELGCQHAGHPDCWIASLLANHARCQFVWPVIPAQELKRASFEEKGDSH